jgi:hypothetical protein
MSDAGQRESRDPVRRKSTFLQTFRTIAWSFFGVRKAADHENDVSELNPAYVVVAGVVGALVLVLILASVVNWVLSSGVAA